MRPNDKLVEAVQNAVVNYQVGDLEICFEYESQDEIANIEIYKDGKNRPVAVFTYDDMTVETISKDYPQFFNKPVTKKTVRQFLREEWNENGGHITKKAILKNACDRIGSYQTYADVEGMYMAVYSFWGHNVEDFIEVENAKWVGYEVKVDEMKTDWLMRNYGVDSIKLIVPTWVMNLEAKSERHAANLFNKYLKRL